MTFVKRVFDNRTCFGPVRADGDGQWISEYITIYHPRTQYGENRKAEINWSALGSVDRETTNAFALALIRATFEAQILNSDAGFDDPF